MGVAEAGASAATAGRAATPSTKLEAAPSSTSAARAVVVAAVGALAGRPLVAAAERSRPVVPSSIAISRPSAASIVAALAAIGRSAVIRTTQRWAATVEGEEVGRLPHQPPLASVALDTQPAAAMAVAAAEGPETSSRTSRRMAPPAASGVVAAPAHGAGPVAAAASVQVEAGARGPAGRVGRSEGTVDTAD